MRHALLILRPLEPAVFSARPATEGVHRSLRAPTGASLLGWATRFCYGETCADAMDPTAVFHNGQVRFSNALPLSSQGRPAYPLPQVLTEPKHARGGFIKNKDTGREVLNAEIACIGRPQGETQYDTLGRDGIFLALDGEKVQPALGSRLRTAIEDGRAATGQLFGYAHVEPGPGLRYAATIDADDGVLTHEQWRRLLDAFRDRELRLGRAANTGYGGLYACTVTDNAGADLWPAGAVPAHAELLRVWALSDLALVGPHGSPILRPASSASLGLPPRGQFDASCSAITTRRYAPWNATLRARACERQVIEAGSVLSFRYPSPPKVGLGPGLVGTGREVGLGRIVVGPAMLSGERPTLNAEAPVLDTTAGVPAVVPGIDEDHDLVRWALSRLPQGTSA